MSGRTAATTRYGSAEAAEVEADVRGRGRSSAAQCAEPSSCDPCSVSRHSWLAARTQATTTDTKRSSPGIASHGLASWSSPRNARPAPMSGAASGEHDGQEARRGQVDAARAAFGRPRRRPAARGDREDDAEHDEDGDPEEHEADGGIGHGARLPSAAGRSC